MLVRPAVDVSADENCNIVALVLGHIELQAVCTRLMDRGRPVTSRRLRWSSSSTLVVPVTRRATLGDCSFPVAATQAWNSLPDFVTTAPITSHRSVPRWRRICSVIAVLILTDIDNTVNTRQTDFITCSWLKRCALAPRNHTCSLLLIPDAILYLVTIYFILFYFSKCCIVPAP